MDINRSKISHIALNVCTRHLVKKQKKNTSAAVNKMGGLCTVSARSVKSRVISVNFALP